MKITIDNTPHGFNWFVQQGIKTHYKPSFVAKYIQKQLDIGFWNCTRQGLTLTDFFYKRSAQVRQEHDKFWLGRLGNEDLR